MADIGQTTAVVSDPAAAAGFRFLVVDPVKVAANIANPPPAPQVPELAQVPATILAQLAALATGAATSRTRRLTLTAGNIQLLPTDVDRQVLTLPAGVVTRDVALPSLPGADQHFRIVNGGGGVLNVTDGAGNPLLVVQAGRYAEFVWNADPAVLAWEVDNVWV